MLEVSIIIPVYNGISYIDKCLDAIVASGAPTDKYEIIAVDDNSTDGSLEKLQALEANIGNMRVYHRRKAGPGGARNLGLNYAKGRYIMFVDVDDRVNSREFAQLVNVLIGLYDHQIIGFDCVKVDAQGTETPFHEFVLPYCREMTGTDYMGRYPLMGVLWGYLFNRSFLLKLNVRFLEKSVLEDEDFVTRVFSRAESVTFLPIQLYYYYAENKSGLSNIPEIEHQSRLMRDRLSVITGLKRMREAVCDPQLEAGLDRKLCDLSVDTIRILINKPYEKEQMAEALENLSKQGLYPLPQGDYGKYYSRLRRATSTLRKIVRWKRRRSGVIWRYWAWHFLHLRLS
ncbi:MAG: glycosyltransferase [Porphyromonadaceae bacterium]|nr:glycosyltransferase [Porphyromonadaceae bacterium]